MLNHVANTADLAASHAVILHMLSTTNQTGIDARLERTNSIQSADGIFIDSINCYSKKLSSAQERAAVKISSRNDRHMP
jgi:hypothetical protein